MLQKIQILFICFFILSGICLLITIILPIVFQKKLNNKLDDNSTSPDIDNIDLWAKFPGKIKSNLINSFSLYNYTLDNNQNITATPIELFNISETINYSDFNFNDKKKITFKAEKSHKINKNNLKNQAIMSIDMGNIESIETLANPPKYQIGINSLSYLFGIFFPDYLYFAKQIFTFNFYTTNFTSDEKILNFLEEAADIDEETAKKMLEDDNYGLNNITHFFEYILILNDSKAIESAKWLDNFNLSETKKFKLLGNESILTSCLEQFLSGLKDNFCEEKLCDDKIIFNQLLDQSITKKYFINDIKNLYEDLYLVYPFTDKVEMNYYFDNYFSKTITKGDYKDYKLSVEIMEQLFKKDTLFSLYSPNNTVLLLIYNNSIENYKPNNFLNLTNNQLLFLNEYLFSYLPSIIFHQEFKLSKNGETYKINQLSLIYTNLVNYYVQQTYYKLITNITLYNYTRVKIAEKRFKDKIKDEEERKEYCMDTWQEILDDGKRVLKLCTNPSLQLTTASGMVLWANGYNCVHKKSDDCSTIDYLRSLIYITDEELEQFYSDEKFGQFVQGIDEQVQDKYGCSGPCNDTELAYLQWVNQYITLNPPDEIKEMKSNTIAEWFPEIFDKPIEFGYYKDLSGCTEENCNSKSINYTILLGNNSDNFKIKNEQAYEIKTLFKKMHTLFLTGNVENEFTEEIGIKNSKLFFEVFDYYINYEIFGNLFKIYDNPNDIVTGYSSENSKGMQFLSTGGEYYDNFKPNIKQITGFNLYTDSKLKNEDELLFDYYSISKDKSSDLRKIVEINNISLLNIFTKEYDSSKKDYINLYTNIFNFYKIDDKSNFLNDGFQFSEDKKTILYYDEFSSRIFKFKRSGSDKFNSISCKKYEMDDDINMGIQEIEDIEFNLDKNKVLISQKFKKPMIVSTTDADLNYIKKIKSKNFICVNTDSNLVIKSEFNLIYSIYSKDYKTLNRELENRNFYPLILYKRTFEVDKKSYNKIFDFIDSYNNKKKFVLIFGIIGIFIFLALGAFFLYIFIKKNKISSNDNNNDTKINSIQSPLVRNSDNINVNDVN
jgi:hypothetical protein